MSEKIIQCKIYQTGRTIQVSLGQSGTLKNHASLDNLSYDLSGHTDFQKKLVYDEGYGCFIVE